MIKQLLAKILCAFNIHPWKKLVGMPFATGVHCKYCNKYLGKFWKFDKFGKSKM